MKIIISKGMIFIGRVYKFNPNGGGRAPSAAIWLNVGSCEKTSRIFEFINKNFGGSSRPLPREVVDGGRLLAFSGRLLEFWRVFINSTAYRKERISHCTFCALCNYSRVAWWEGSEMRSFRCGVFSPGRRGKDGVRWIYKRSQFVEMAAHAENEMGA